MSSRALDEQADKRALTDAVPGQRPRQLIGATIQLGVGQRAAAVACRRRIGRAPDLLLEQRVNRFGRVPLTVVRAGRQPAALFRRR